MAHQASGVSVLPALASLRVLRRAARRDPVAKPLTGCGDPVFDPAERAKALAERHAKTRVAVTRGYLSDSTMHTRPFTAPLPMRSIKVEMRSPTFIAVCRG
jgi:hypothetical protein